MDRELSRKNLRLGVILFAIAAAIIAGSLALNWNAWRFVGAETAYEAGASTSAATSTERNRAAMRQGRCRQRGRGATPPKG